MGSIRPSRDQKNKAVKLESQKEWERRIQNERKAREEEREKERKKWIRNDWWVNPSPSPRTSDIQRKTAGSGIRVIHSGDPNQRQAWQVWQGKDIRYFEYTEEGAERSKRRLEVMQSGRWLKGL